MNKTDNASKIGQGMVYIAWIMLLVMLTFAFNKYLDQQNNPNQNVYTRQSGDIAEVILKQNRYGHYLANGLINNSPVTFMLDTGATVISIPETLAKKLRLKKGHPIRSSTANGYITVYSTLLKSVSIGAIELNNIRASINPHMRGDEILLGMSFMKHLEMTQKEQQMILRY
jgi:aspartyl protease family protein